jgi:hypothetical protein
MKREVKAEFMARNTATFDESMELLEKKLQALGYRDETKKLAEGWTKTPDGHWVPPGYGLLAPSAGAGRPGGQASGGEPPCETM